MKSNLKYFEEEALNKHENARLLRRIYPFIKAHIFLLFASVFMIILITFVNLAMPYITRIAIDDYIVPQKQSVIDNKNYLKIDINNPESKQIVILYKELFKIDGNVAYIEYDKLSKLKKSDIVILREKDISGITVLSILLLVLVIINFVINFIEEITMEFLGQKIIHDIRLKLFNHIQSLEVDFFSRNSVGRLVTRVTNDIQNMHEMFTSILTFLFKDLFLIFGIITVLITVNLKLALICFSFIPFAICMTYFFARCSRNIFRILRIKIAEINSKFAETVGGVKVIQLFQEERNNYNEFKHLNRQNYLASMKQIHIFALFTPVIEVMGAITLAIIIYYGGSAIMSRDISLGVLVLFISYMKMFYRPIRDIAEKYNIMQNAMASAERIFLIFNANNFDGSRPEDLTVKNNQARNPGEDIRIEKISFKNISFFYLKDEMILNNISFELFRGQTLAIVGPTGSGKTTLINLIVQFYKAISGSILINDRDIKEYNVASIRSRISVVTQEPFLFSGTIRDNILHGKNISQDEFEIILKSSNCKPFIDRLPDGVDTILNEEAASISSGERQLISIARAFANNPDLIILDEATSYIDSESEIEIQKALSNLTADRAAIIIAHRLSTVRKADDIIVLKDGNIIEMGSHEELMTEKGFYYRMNMTD